MLALFSPGLARTMTLKLAAGLACAFTRGVDGPKAALLFAASAEPAPNTRANTATTRNSRPPLPQRALVRVLLFVVRCWGCRMCPFSQVFAFRQSCVAA